MELSVQGGCQGTNMKRTIQQHPVGPKGAYAKAHSFTARVQDTETLLLYARRHTQRY